MHKNNQGNRTPRDADEFEKQLDRQLAFLERSSDLFDQGNYDEAVRLATTIRVLVYDSGGSTSVLTHLGLRESLQYIDTGVYRDLLDPALLANAQKLMPDITYARASAEDIGLVELGDAGGGKVGWYAPLRLRRFGPGTPPDLATKDHSNFGPWWTDPLVESSSGKLFSRFDLIKIMANQDGGAHVDAGLDADYRALSHDSFLSAEHGPDVGNKFPGGDIPEAVHNVAFASVRQIAFELSTTIKRFRYLRSNPHVLELADPFVDLPMPRPPHRPMNLSAVVMLG
jgi:hypothetical protein